MLRRNKGNTTDHYICCRLCDTEHLYNTYINQCVWIHSYVRHGTSVCWSIQTQVRSWTSYSRSNKHRRTKLEIVNDLQPIHFINICQISPIHWQVSKIP